VSAGPGSRWLLALRRWFDASAQEAEPGATGTDWPRVIPFALLHMACLGVLWVGWSPLAVGVAAVLYALRMFAITGFYHRYFSHRAFKTSRAAQFVFACLGASAVQRGPLWWAGHHRDHHRFSDTPLDPHSPRVKGFWTSHVGWFLTRENFATRWANLRDFEGYPELRFLDRFDVLVPALLAAALFGLGELLSGWGTSGWQMLVWGFFISTVVLYHATFSINSLAHVIGRQRYETGDDSRNSLLLALITFGEGWHNNHHRFPTAVRQGHRWWQLDVTWYALALLARLGIVWELAPLPRAARSGGPRATEAGR
jgi:stearoyl-CoA desaturase (delta-9 desaturase)